MPVPIFDQPVITEKSKEELLKKEKPTGWTIFFSILLIIVFVIMGEMAFRDINKLYNPLYESCQVVKEGTFFSLKISEAEKACQMEKYEFTRLILHLDIVAPLFIIGLILFFILRRNKNMAIYAKIIIYSYSIFTAWLILRIVSETEYFLLKHHRMIGWYVVLMTVAFIIIFFIIFIQRKSMQKIKELSYNYNKEV